MQDKTNYKTNLKINYNKSIKDKEKKILEYYKRKSNLEANKNQLPKLKKRTKKYIPNTDKNINMQETDQKINDSTKSSKLTKTAKLPTPELTKPKFVEMD